MNTSLNALVANCWELIKGIPHTKLYHCNKEANRCLDAHASRGCLSLDLTLFLEPLGEVAIVYLPQLGKATVLSRNFECCSSLC